MQIHEKRPWGRRLRHVLSGPRRDALIDLLANLAWIG